jgi:phosphopantothenoylcysteine decarboxylase/phosphopantothenate--cysteine ligase
MGFAIAEAAAARGAHVLLVAGPVHLPTPHGVTRADVRSAAQLRDAVLGALPADVYIGAAAVADWTPRSVSPIKLKKTPGAQTLTLELVRTPDTLAEIAAHPQRPRLVVGFAAETDELERYARGKLAAKRLDLIAANRVGVAGSGFESDDNTLIVFGRDGAMHTLGPAGKRAVAEGLLDLIAVYSNAEEHG